MPPKIVKAAAKTPPRQAVPQRTEGYAGPKATGNLATLVQWAFRQVGKRYVYGAAGPTVFDCSGLALAGYRTIGISLPHQTGALASRGRAVSRADLRPGDLVFPTHSHVGIYVGNGMMVHASTPRGGVKYSKVYAFAFARRIVG